MTVVTMEMLSDGKWAELRCWCFVCSQPCVIFSANRYNKRLIQYTVKLLIRSERRERESGRRWVADESGPETRRSNLPKDVGVA